MEYNWLLILIPGLPLLGAAIIVTGIQRKWSRSRLAAIGCTAVGLAFLATVGGLVSYVRLPSVDVLHVPIFSWTLPGFDIGLLGDAISFWFALVVTGVGLLIHLFSAHYMADDPGYPRFFAKLNFFIYAMSMLVLADGFVGMIIGWANVGVASYLLIGFWNRKPAAAAAARKAFWVNTVGEVGLILAAVAMYTQFGSVRFADVLPQAWGAPEGVLNAIALLLLVGAVAKSAQLPLHVWLPDAMQGPTPVSALIHAATMVTAGVYLTVRAFPIFEAAPLGLPAVALVGIASVLFGAVVALRQNDIKRILAFSTMSQVGYMILGAGVGAYSAALFHFMTHAFFKALLFLAAGVVINRFGGEQDIRRMGGLGRNNPFLYWVFLIGTLALVGLPPLAGFFSKDEIVLATLLAGHPWLWGFAVVGAGLTAFYMMRLFSLVFVGPSSAAAQAGAAAGEVAAAAETGANRSAPVPTLKAIPLLVLTVLSAVGGFLSVPGLTEVPAAFLGRVLGRYANPLATSVAAAGMGDGQATTLTLGLLLAVAVIGGGLALAKYGPRRQPEGEASGLALAAANGFYFDNVYRAVIVRPLRAVARIIGDVAEPHIIDGAVNGVARLAATMAGAVRRIHTGHVRRYALALMAGVTVVLIYFVMFF